MIDGGTLLAAARTRPRAVSLHRGRDGAARRRRSIRRSPRGGFVYLYYTRSKAGTLRQPRLPLHDVGRDDRRRRASSSSSTRSPRPATTTPATSASARTATSTSASATAAATTPATAAAPARTTPRATSTSSSARSCASRPTAAFPRRIPFQGAGTARCNVTGRTTAGNRCQETFAWGLRNPFRFAFDPNASGDALLHQRRRPGSLGGDRPRAGGRRLRLERPRGAVRERLGRRTAARRPPG